MKEQIKSLVEKSDRYLHSAGLLRDAEDYDSAASRLYYAILRDVLLR